MSRIHELIESLCPDGVQRVSLGNVTTNFDSKRRPVTKSDRKIGAYPYYGANGIQDWVDDYLFDGIFLLVGEDGSVQTPDGKPVLNWAEGKIWVNNHAHVLQSSTDNLDLRFLFFVLQTIEIRSLVTGGTQPKLNQKNLNSIQVPLPPLEVQQEIVRILDQFTQLEAELEAELEARRAQQSHIHRLVVKTLESSKVPLVPLGDTGTWFGGGTPSKSVSDFWSNGTIPWISPKDMGQPVVHSTEDHITERAIAASATKLIPEGSVAIVTRSSILDHTLPIAFVPQEATLNQDVKAVRSHAGIEPEYLFHILRTMRPTLLRFARREGGSVASLETKKLMSFRIPVPDLNEQKRIIDLLENFEMLVSDLTSGLPAELAARRKQYEYYRDKLLTFKELAA
ncbi:type I restriction enzyme S subunit [Neomicrococcus aestuarii]|uniref:Type I restriction enzyme S subunit n=1 Tax=Neomicrococcus aestuarii TaxID=556325 RepID=A0A7W8TSN3_9MICC|nr:restriction endonuclease subunit S [Neomicrococcus aestuarii]MBB5512202.1 type I restriction enzyme S subunit [Neomicrococcus aestuarii]